MTKLASVQLTTPWFPEPYNRMNGSFVADHAALVARLADQVRVVHAQEWPAGPEAAAARWQPSFDAVLDRATRDGSLEVPGGHGPVLRVPVLIVEGQTMPQRAEAAVRDVRRVAGTLTGDVVHGHVGYLGGLIAVRLADPATSVFVTEHSSGLAGVLADPQGRDHYAEVLDRASRVFCVSSVVRGHLVDALPEYAGTVEVMPNPVRFTGVPRRGRPDTLRRWLFAGNLTEIKGVQRLVLAFARAAAEHPDLELTMYGQGPLRERLVEIARDHGVAERLHLPGVVPHEQLLAAMPGHDVLFAPSVRETFHLVVPEAVAAGLPVITTRSGGAEETLADVADQVGRIVDVEDSPDQLLDAWRDLEAGLGRLDLDAARSALDARLGPDAVAHRLAAAYGLAPDDVTPDDVTPDDVTPDDAAAGLARPATPERIVILSVTGWRRYSVEAELASARAHGVPVVVATHDPGIAALADGLPVRRPEDLAPLPAPAPPEPPPAGRTGRTGRLAARLRRQPAVTPAATPPAVPPAPAPELIGATVVVCDCQSMPDAERMAALAGVRLRVELPSPR